MAKTTDSRPPRRKKLPEEIALERAKEIELSFSGKGFTDAELDDHVKNHRYILSYLTNRKIPAEEILKTLDRELCKMDEFRLMRMAHKYQNK